MALMGSRGTHLRELRFERLTLVSRLRQGVWVRILNYNAQMTGSAVISLIVYSV